MGLAPIFSLLVNNSDEPSSTAGAQTLRRALELLRLVATSQEAGMGVSELVLKSELSRPTVHRLLQVLCEEGVLERHAASRRYKIGPEVPLLGLARGGRMGIRLLAEPYLRQLSNEVGDTVFLSVRQGLDSIGVERISGRYPIQIFATDVGVRRPLGLGVAGLAILAGLPSDEADAILLRNQKRLSAHGLSLAVMQQRVRHARERGHAWAARGLVPGTSAVSVAVPDSGDVRAAVSVAAMKDRLAGARLAHVVAAIQVQVLAIARRRKEVQQAKPPRR